MLSKLRHFGQDGPRPRATPELAPLLTVYGGRLKNLRPVATGALNICYLADVDDVPRFFKTHSTQSGRETLKREALLLDFLYGAALEVEATVVDKQLWLGMNALEAPSEAPTPAQIMELTKETFVRLNKFNQKALIPRQDSLSTLLIDGSTALDMLVGTGAIPLSLFRDLRRELSGLRDHDLHSSYGLCHGDLGPRNLMTLKGDLFAIDLEDVFHGPAGYDFLYWLTFLENRRHYGPEILGRTQWNEATEIALMALIVVLKSALFIRQERTHSSLKITVEERLGEILRLANTTS